MEKEKVLEIESQEVFDRVAFKIKYQNEQVLQRGKFKDWEVRIISDDNESVGYHNIHDFLNIRNNYKNADNCIDLVSRSEFESIKERVKKLNEKYGIPKRWRGERSDKYFSIFGDSEISKVTDNYFPEDQRRYEWGNYFKTEEEAEKVKEELDKFWAKVRAGEIE